MLNRQLTSKSHICSEALSHYSVWEIYTRWIRGAVGNIAKGRAYWETEILSVVPSNEIAFSEGTCLWGSLLCNRSSLTASIFNYTPETWRYNETECKSRVRGFESPQCWWLNLVWNLINVLIVWWILLRCLLSFVYIKNFKNI